MTDLNWKNLPEDLREAYARECRDARAAAKIFAAACASGDAAAFYRAVDRLNVQGNSAWHWAMMRVARLPSVRPEIRAAFLTIWIESKMLPLRVGNRRVLALALRIILLPGPYRGPSMRLYRGAGWHERCRRVYGFSWTIDKEVAQSFAERSGQLPPGGFSSKRSLRPRRSYSSGNPRTITMRARSWSIPSGSV